MKEISHWEIWNDKEICLGRSKKFMDALKLLNYCSNELGEKCVIRECFPDGEYSVISGLSV